MLVVLDIDGVLANCDHRLHYLNEKDYDSFYSEEEMLKDEPIKEGLELLEILLDNWEVELYLMTGRPYRTEDATRKWLSRQRQDFGELIMIMRKDHDYRPSDEVKLENMLKMEKLMNKDRDDSILFIDDDLKNVQAVEKGCGKVKGILFGTSRL